MPVPSAPPPAARHKSAEKAADKAAEKSPPKPSAKTDAPTAPRQHLVNELLPFLGFVERHPIGSTVRGVVESYSSHGAYVALGDARGYVPLRLMADPPPRSAREAMKLASEVDLVVVSFNPTRRSIDLSVPGMEPPEVRALVEAKARPGPAKRSRKKAPAEAPTAAAKAVKRGRATAGPAPDAALAAVPDGVPAKRTRKKAVVAEPPPEPPAKRARKRAGVAEAAPAAAAKAVKRSTKKSAS
jgi:hypothetical protein